MKALILAAGEGTRLRPLTSNVPKPLLMVAGRPFLSHVLDALKELGITDIAILVGWKSDRIREHYKDGSELGLKITYLEQKERMGTAHAIGMTEGIMDSSFICINGDVVLFKEDIARTIQQHESSGNAVLTAVRTEDPKRFGVVEEKDGKLVRLIEKPKNPPTDLINAGLFIFNTEVFDQIRATACSPRGEYEITDTLNAMAKGHDIDIVQLKEGWLDVGRPWDLLKANNILMSSIKGRIDGTVEAGAYLKGEVVVEKGALVRSGAYIEGPCYISEGCDIGPNCYIRPSTCLGRDVRVGASVEVKNSIIMAGSHIPHHNYVGDSIIGERCNLGAGTKVANLRFDDGQVKVAYKGELIPSGRRKLGVIMGDDVKTGINSMIDAGTVICENSIIGPGAIAHGHIAPDSKVL